MNELDQKAVEETASRMFKKYGGKGANHAMDYAREYDTGHKFNVYWKAVCEEIKRLGFRGTYKTDQSKPTEAPATVAKVNKALKGAGHPERLTRGRGYYYFAGGNAAGWHTSSVYVNNVGAFTVAGWVEERNRLAGDE